MLRLAHRRVPSFAFLVHPRDIEDLYRWRGAPLLRKYSASEEEFLTRALSTPPVVLGEILFGVTPVYGELIGVMRMPEQVLQASGRQLVSEAAQVAARRGARVVGLGALTAPVTRGGHTLVPDLPRGVILTTGNAYTAAVARDNVIEACNSLRLTRPACVAVIGCTGSVGAAVSRLLAEENLDLILLGRSLQRIEHALADLADRAAFSNRLADVRRADVVLLLTSDPSAQLQPPLVCDCDQQATVDQEIIVIDVAQPSNVAAAAYKDFRRCGVTVVEGGLVEIPGYVCTQDIGLPPGATYACLAETYLFAREGVVGHSVGPASVELARMLERAARRRGVRTRPLDLGAREQLPLARSSAAHGGR